MTLGQEVLSTNEALTDPSDGESTGLKYGHGLELWAPSRIGNGLSLGERFATLNPQHHHVSK